MKNTSVSGGGGGAQNRPAHGYSSQDSSAARSHGGALGHDGHKILIELFCFLSWISSNVGKDFKVLTVSIIFVIPHIID